MKIKKLNLEFKKFVDKKSKKFLKILTIIQRYINMLAMIISREKIKKKKNKMDKKFF